MQKTLQNKDGLGLAGTLTITRMRDGKVIEVLGPYKNKVVTGASGYGRNLILRQLSNDTTYPIVITTISLGDGTAAPADSDTALGNSLVANLSVSDYDLSNNVLTVTTFCTDAQVANDTYAELGLFCSGRLFARILITPNYTKATGEDTIFTYTLTATG